MQMVYDHVYAANRADFADGLYEWFTANMPRYEAYCQRLFGVKGGAAAYCPTALDGRCLFDWWQIAFWLGGGPWLTTYFWRHWLATGDREFLRDRTYPLLVKFATTYLGVLVRSRDGRLHLDFTMSPEYPRDDLRHVWIGPDATMDLALARWTLTTLLDAERELGLATPLARRARQALTKLADYDAYNALTGRDNVLAVGRGQPLTQSHRHHSHLAPIYPLGLLSPFNPADRDLVEGSLGHLVYRGMGGVGRLELSVGVLPVRARPDAQRRPPACCALRGGIRLAKHLPHQQHLSAQGRPGQQYLAVHVRRGQLHVPRRRAGDAAPVPRVAGAACGWSRRPPRTGIVIFPGIPDDWHTRDVAFDSLRAEGGFLIDARMVAGRFACARIRSTRGGTCTLRDNFPPGWRLVTAQGGSASVKGKPLPPNPCRLDHLPDLHRLRIPSPRARRDSRQGQVAPAPVARASLRVREPLWYKVRSDKIRTMMHLG